MKTLIVSGGTVNQEFGLALIREERFDRIIGVDKGMEFLYHNQILPAVIVGDFDSVDKEVLFYYREQTQVEIRAFNPVKDATDTQIALEFAMGLGSTEVCILGGTGTRLDHVLGNIQMLPLALEQGVKCCLVDEHNRICLLDHPLNIRREQQFGTYVSLLPFTERVSGLTLRGFKYSLKDFMLKSGSGGLGVSNEIVKELAEIDFKDGILIMIQSKD